MQENNKTDILDSSPLISILCLSMNHERFIEKSIHSALAQTYSNLEFIYLDNFSSDTSYEKASAMFKACDRPASVYRREKSFGISANLNFMLGYAKGKYISTLSADDWWDITNIEEKVAFYEKNPQYGLLHGAGYICYYDTGEIVREPVLNSKSGWMLKEVLKRNFINTNGVLLRKDVLNEVGLFDEQSNLEDWDMWIRIAEIYPIVFFEKPLAYYGKQSANVSDNKAYMKEGYEYIFKKYRHYKEVHAARDYYKMVDVYEAAMLQPSLDGMRLLIKHFRFSAVHIKQMGKIMLAFFGISVGNKKRAGKK